MKKLLDLCEGFSLGRRFFFCILMASVNFSHADEFFNFAELKTAANFTLPNENDREKTFSGNTGLRLSFRDADFRGFVTLPKTEFDEIRSSENIREKLDLFDNPCLGAGFFLFKKNFPTTIKIGHNSYSKSVSKLKSPSPPTTANPLAKSFAFSTGIGASLTSLTSSTQPVSYSICTKSLEKMFPVQFSAESFVLKLTILVDLARVKMAMVVDDGLILRVIMIQVLRRLGGQQKILIHKRLHQRFTRAPAPPMMASTSLTEAMEVSPGVVIASAPWAAP